MRTLTILATGIAIGMAIAVWPLSYDDLDDLDDLDDVMRGRFEELYDTLQGERFVP